MNFIDLDIKKKYRSSDTVDIGKNFIEKVLCNSVCYKRAVGFFSSSSLIYTSRGLSKIASMYKGGAPIIQYIVSPKLSKEDAEAIQNGYATREKVIESAMLRSFEGVETKYEKERLNMIAHLISIGAMDIKVAVTEIAGQIGMYHEKIGIFSDFMGSKVAFTGSLNESATAYLSNFESIRVYRSWEGEQEDCFDIEYDFNNLWENATRKVQIYSFPLAVKNRILEYKQESYNPLIDEIEDVEREKEQVWHSDVPNISKSVELFDYQKDAIRQWLKQKGCGIFDMATGTGKTFTAYGAIVKLLEKSKNKLATIIVCPYQHLVEQWVEDTTLFNIKNIIIGYSSSKYADYLTKLKTSVQNYNDGLIEHFFFICTNASFMLGKVQSVLGEIRKKALLVVDEAHNIGAKKIQSCLKDNFTFRLGLSATIERYRDEEGTRAIFNFFGKKCIEYDMERAIAENKLTKYRYIPIIVALNTKEKEEYIELTKLVRKNSYKGKSGKIELTKLGEMHAIRRARLVAGCNDKVNKLREEMKNHLEENNMLVYCGTSKLATYDGEEIKQIDQVSKMLGNELNLNVERYTSRESAEERIKIKKRFQNGELQALVAIKCLDEGVNIPAIRTAFILASSTNPREYIQRRGRVLRLSDGKRYATIYDFVTLPFDLNGEQTVNQILLEDFKSLAVNEVKRMEEFSRLSLNPSDTLAYIDKIKQLFNLNEFTINNEFEEIEWSEENYE